MRAHASTLLDMQTTTCVSRAHALLPMHGNASSVRSGVKNSTSDLGMQQDPQRIHEYEKSLALATDPLIRVCPPSSQASLSWAFSRQRRRPGFAVEVTSSGFNCQHGPFVNHPPATRVRRSSVLFLLELILQRKRQAEGPVQVETWSCDKGIRPASASKGSFLSTARTSRCPGSHRSPWPPFSAAPQPAAPQPFASSPPTSSSQSTQT